MQCEKKCIANINGDCAVTVCRGAIIGIDIGTAATVEIAANRYSFVADLFDDLFGKERIGVKDNENTQ